MLMFYGDFRNGEDAQTFLAHFEAFLTTLPAPTESEKCYRFYLHCHSGWDSEEWYKEFENSSPEVLTSWTTLRKHFHIKWLDANPNILLEIPETKDSTIRATSTATDSNNTTMTTTIEQQGDEKSTVEENEEVKGVEEQDKTGKREAERRQADAGEQVRTATTQSTPAHFDWATEVDEALGLIPIERNTSQSTSANPTPILLGDPVPNDVIVDPVRTRYANVGAVPEALSEPESCGEQATMWNRMGNLQGTELLTTRTTPNNTKHPPQPPSPPSPLTQRYSAIPTTPNSATDSEHKYSSVTCTFSVQIST